MTVAAAPRRIQRQRTKGWRMPADAVYVGRPSQWGNRFVAGERPHPDHIGGGVFPCDCHILTADAAVRMFRVNASLTRRLDTWLAPLRGKRLACWCPESCGEQVALYGVAYGDLYEPCAKPAGHDGGHDPSVPPWCHADVLIELLEARGW